MIKFDKSIKRYFDVTFDQYKFDNNDVIKKSINIAHDEQEQTILRLRKLSRRVMIMLCRSKKH